MITEHPSPDMLVMHPTKPGVHPVNLLLSRSSQNALIAECRLFGEVDSDALTPGLQTPREDVAASDAVEGNPHLDLPPEQQQMDSYHSRTLAATVEGLRSVRPSDSATPSMRNTGTL